MKRSLAILLLLCGTAQAHDWYPNECCHGRDCYHATNGEVEVTAAGYLVHGELIPFSDPRIRTDGSEDGFHICKNYQRRENALKCLFTPSAGS